jgi:integrase
MTHDQSAIVLNAFDGHILKPLIATTLYYGLRRSEVLGLKWEAIDFENETLEIKHTVVKFNSIIAKDKTKNTASHATYKLLPEVKKMLEDLKSKQDENRKLFGDEYKGTGYVFTWQDGRLFRPDYVTKTFQKVLKQNDLPKLRFHDLRHSCASILYDKKWQEKDVQEWMRHADIQTTMNIYTHISESRKEIMAKDLEGLFNI